jgi:hypothetical protein
MAAKLKLVSSNKGTLKGKGKGKGKTLQPPFKRHKSDPLHVYDDIYFSKDDIYLGSHLMYHGFYDNMTEWVVTGITTHTLGRRVGQIIQNQSNVTSKSTDRIQIRLLDSTITRTISFQYIRDSARWRLCPRNHNNPNNPHNHNRNYGV